MKRKLYTILIALGVICCIFADVSELSRDDKAPESDQMLFAHVIFRHGDRTIIKQYPNEIYKSPDYWSEGFGQVTKVSVAQYICTESPLYLVYHSVYVLTARQKTSL